MKKDFLTTQLVFIYLGISLLYALGIFFFTVLLFGIDLYQTDSGILVSFYSLITAVLWVYFICKKIVNKINSAFEDIEKWILKISTPAAAVAVGTGVFMRKFSFGDEEKIRTGKKIIRGSLFSYAFILAIDLILSAIKSLIS